MRKNRGNIFGHGWKTDFNIPHKEAFKVGCYNSLWLKAAWERNLERPSYSVSADKIYIC